MRPNAAMVSLIRISRRLFELVVSFNNRIAEPISKSRSQSQSLRVVSNNRIAEQRLLLESDMLGFCRFILLACRIPIPQI